MRTHEDDLSVRAVPASPSIGRQPEGAAVAQRAVSSGNTAVLDRAAVSHLQRTAGNGAVSSMLEEEDRSPVLDVVGSGGSPLEGRTRAEMESSFGHDFGDVRIHTDSAAAASATSVQAQAYTVGNDIVFGEGRYAPQTDSGRHTLAHELAHVVQQRSGPVDGTPAAGGVAVSHPSDRFEQAAESAAAQMTATGMEMRSESPDGGPHGTIIQRQDGSEEHDEDSVAESD